MIDPIGDVLAPTVIERALSIFGSFKDRARVDLVQARKALTPGAHTPCLRSNLWADR